MNAKLPRFVTMYLLFLALMQWLPLTARQEAFAAGSFQSQQEAATNMSTNHRRESPLACNVNAVTVVGHTDTSGSSAYNVGLSNRRASVVRDALVSRGMAAGAITSSGVGETDLAKPTRDGVREPLNRRTAVTITFQ